MNIFEYGIVNWLMDYHFVGTIVTGTIINLILWSGEIIRIAKEIYDD